MKTEKREIKSYENYYVAEDGREFTDPNECQKYERSFAGAMKGILAAMSLNKRSEEGIFNCGNCDNEVYVLVPRNGEDILRIRQFMAGCGQTGSYLDRASDDLIGKVVLLTIGYDNDGAWLDTLDDIVERITDGKYEAVKKSE